MNEPIKKEFERITKNLNRWKRKLVDLQAECKHSNVTKKYGANTGNYDPSADCYWIDWHCPDCDKRWQTEQ